MMNLPNSTGTTNLQRKIAGLFSTLAVIGLVLMFSVAVFVIILVVGVIGGAMLLWKTRHVRRQMRDFQTRPENMWSNVAEGEMVRGEVIEGEVIRVDEPGVKR